MLFPYNSFPSHPAVEDLGLNSWLLTSSNRRTTKPPFTVVRLVNLSHLHDSVTLSLPTDKCPHASERPVKKVRKG